MRRPASRSILLFASLIVIVALTLTPVFGATSGPPSRCIICGDRGLADALINLALFAPLGLALALTTGGVGRAAGLAMLISFTIEVLQKVVPGRDPSWGDVLFNTTGATMAAAAYLTRRIWLDTSRRVTRGRTLGAAALAVGPIVATGYLFQPSFPPTIYYGQWTPRLGHLEWYRAHVDAVVLGQRQIPSDRLADPSTVATMLHDGVPLTVDFAAGPLPSGLGSLFSIADDEGDEIVLLGPDGPDLVFRLRRRAADWHLDQPDLRFMGVLQTVRPGDAAEVRVWREGRGYCLALDARQLCGLGYSLASGWTLLYGDNLPTAIEALLNIIWVAALFLPLGFVARRGMFTAGVLITTATALVVTYLTFGQVPPTASEIVASAGGFLIGLGTRISLGRGIANTGKYVVPQQQ